MSHSASISVEGSIQSASSSVARLRFAGSMSETASSAPASRQPPGQLRADVAEAGDHDPPAGEVRRAEALASAGPHRGLDAERGERARVAGAAVIRRQPGHVAGPLADRHQVLGVDADVLGGDVAAARATRPGRRSRAAARGARVRSGALRPGRRSLPCRRRGRGRRRPPCRSCPAPAAGRRATPSTVASVVPQAHPAERRARARSSGWRRPRSARCAAPAAPPAPRARRRPAGPPSSDGSTAVGRRGPSVAGSARHAHRLTSQLSSRSLTDPRKRAASAPSSARWSHDMQR